MSNFPWVKPLLASDIPEGTQAIWDEKNEVWTFVPLPEHITYEIIPIDTSNNNP